MGEKFDKPPIINDDDAAKRRKEVRERLKKGQELDKPVSPEEKEENKKEERPGKSSEKSRIDKFGQISRDES